MKGNFCRMVLLYSDIKVDKSKSCFLNIDASKSKAVILDLSPTAKVLGKKELEINL
jgi:hypothetical protein